ncbi:hypothetical protein G4L39_06205 [Limisphaera ngatamarikiensis]|uniref:Uncharacterized protein n=1 Tax=Limisphaera ngatamarikiensis TaxID=1324935 RepID=A0A6M1RG10_9BACT|nr:hypothetical protein [Limisphaera ngatamarikiensis]NGO38988.1 hypothetical protein [Limisphaera ngatamarikiensis]
MAQETIQTERTTAPALGEMEREWPEVRMRLEQLTSRFAVLEEEVRSLRRLLERVIEHRQKSHGELVLLLTGLVSKLPIQDVGTFVSRLVEHNTHVSDILTALGKGQTDAEALRPPLLEALEETKNRLRDAAREAVRELMRLETPLEVEMLQSLIEEPERFFTPPVVRATRCFVKGQVPRERIVRQFGEAALFCFQDMTTDPKLNPRPKPEEIALAFRPEAEELLERDSTLSPEQKSGLLDLLRRIRQSRGDSADARAQREAFTRLSFILDLLHFYENQSTEPVDVVFAQRLPALIEQIVFIHPGATLNEEAVRKAESLLALVLSPEHRLMIINNVGKAGGPARTLKFILRLRAPESTDLEVVVLDFVRHLLPGGGRTPAVADWLPVLRLVPQERQKMVLRALMGSERLPKEKARALAMELADALGLPPMEVQTPPPTLPPEIERERAWEQIQNLMLHHADPREVAAAIRDRLHAHYDADELRQSWLALSSVDPMTFIRVCSVLPYTSNGKTDPIAHPALQSYVTRLMHEKYAHVYQRVLTSLRQICRLKPDSPTLHNFLAVVRWVDPAAAARLTADIGLPAHPGSS